MSEQQPRLSFEFFPPREAKGQEKLAATREALAALNPDFFSITYGAGGSTRDGTRDLALSLQAGKIPVAPHLSFGGNDDRRISELLDIYQKAGIRRIVALRGDAPEGASPHPRRAAEMITFIRKHSGDHFEIEVAAYPEVHPEGQSYRRDIAFLKEKLDAGANNAITQFFYNADAYFYFSERCRAAGIHQPIYPGIMPITSLDGLRRFAAKCGAEIPRWLNRSLDDCASEEELRRFGIEFVTALCSRLLQGGAPGLHFYTLNQSEPVSAIWQALQGLS